MQSKKWKSKIGFILAASGAAVGLGNIQRFPYVVANYGGGAFLAVYLLCILLLGIPLVLAEFSLGRLFQKNPYRVFKESLPQGKFWHGLSFLPIMIPFFIFTYYLVISGWTASFTVLNFFDVVESMDEVTSSPVITLFSTFFCLSLLCWVASYGVNKGVEALSFFLMPILFLFLIFLAVHSLFLEKSFEGLKFFLKADWSKVDGKLFVFAAGQAFFSLCIGEGVLLTYGSYVSKKESLVSSALSMILFDTLVAFLSGLIIFPALFTFGFDLNQDSTLVYKVMPEIFSLLPFGKWLSLCFFLILCFAAITTCLALMEVVVNFFCENFSLSRKKSVMYFFLLSLFPCLLVSLSKGVSPYLSSLKVESLGLRSLFDILDFVYGNLGMLFCGLMVAFIAGYCKKEDLKKEIQKGSLISDKLVGIWFFLLTYLAPVTIFLILLFNFF